MDKNFVTRMNVDGSGLARSYCTFADGWLDETAQKVWGRPVDVLLLPDGSILASDDQAGVVYRIIYKG